MQASTGSLPPTYADRVTTRDRTIVLNDGKFLFLSMGSTDTALPQDNTLARDHTVPNAGSQRTNQGERTRERERKRRRGPAMSSQYTQGG